MLLTNELPRLNDASGALASRFLILNMTESFYRREDHGLTDRLMEELPQIFAWAVDGWGRLQKRGHFVQPKSVEQLVEELDDLGSPTKAFLADCCKIEVGAEIEIGSLFSAWKVWCEEHGRDAVGDVQTFGRNLRAAEPRITKGEKREGYKRSRIYKGIKLS